MFALEKAISAINNEGIVVFPTDTLYGILGSAFSKKAVERIYGVKGRNTKKPLIVLTSKISGLKKFGIREIPKELKKIWPGKVTVILPTKKFPYIHRGSNSIAFRIPKDKNLLKLLAKTGPLVAPSANPEGKPPARNIKEAKKYFGDNIDLYVAGESKSGKPSTIVKYQKGRWKLIREGAVGGEKLKTLLQ
ncbi:MAG TPA: L-threonylcarbamoyladenylate synthase [Candidatus Paceibacterota bacterium]